MQNYDLNFFEAWDKLNEKIEKQATIEYKGFKIEHFPLTWHFKDKEWDNDSWIIQAPGYNVGGDERFPLPLRCHDKQYGPDIEFKTLEEAKAWIDKFGNNYKITIEFGNEIHAWPKTNEALTEAKKELYLITDRKEEFKKVNGTNLSPEYFAHKNKYYQWTITDKASGLFIKSGFNTLAEAKAWLSEMSDEEKAKIEEIKNTTAYKERCDKLANKNLDDYELYENKELDKS